MKDVEIRLNKIFPDYTINCPYIFQIYFKISQAFPRKWINEKYNETGSTLNTLGQGSPTPMPWPTTKTSAVWNQAAEVMDGWACVRPIPTCPSSRRTCACALHLGKWWVCIPTIQTNGAECACPPPAQKHPLSPPPPLVHKSEKSAELCIGIISIQNHFLLSQIITAEW